MAGKERLEDGRLVIRHPSGKVELVASEQERLAQLGARVLEILRAGKEIHVAGGWLANALRECAADSVPAKLNAAEAEGVAERIDAFDAINAAARSLGLLGEEGGQ